MCATSKMNIEYQRDMIDMTIIYALCGGVYHEAVLQDDLDEGINSFHDLAELCRLSGEYADVVSAAALQLSIASALSTEEATMAIMNMAQAIMLLAKAPSSFEEVTDATDTAEISTEPRTIVVSYLPVAIPQRTLRELYGQGVDAGPGRPVRG